MSGFKIDKDIPIPAGGKYSYPFKDMKIGDSFLVLLNNRDNRNVTMSILNAARVYKITHKGEKFTTRFCKEEKGIRCWRTE